MTLLRLSTQQSRTGPVLDGVLRLIANHLDLPIFESAPEVRVLCSAGITQPQCSYDPVRLPPEPPPIATLRPLPSLTTDLPPITRTTFPTCRAYYPGGPRRVHMSVASPSAWAFPEQQSGRHPQVPFRGLLRLHARYGPLDRSAAQWRPLSRGFDPAGCP